MSLDTVARPAGSGAAEIMNLEAAEHAEAYPAGMIKQAAITVTDSAALKVWELIQQEGHLRLKLRVFITGGGCSGFQYGFSFDEVVNTDDTVFKRSISATTEMAEEVVVEFLVDPMSLNYLVGGEIDYKADLQGERFIIRNPNAKTTCGCGSSFSIASE